MPISTVNPYTGEKLNNYNEESESDITGKIHGMREAQKDWRKDLDERISYLKNDLKPALEREKSSFANLMSSEMGKPVSQSIAEVEKCIKLLDYAVENFPKFLEHDVIKTEAARSYVRFDPIGVVLIIMPWNFPMWQVMRAAIPALAAGNGVILKHASIVTGTSLKLEETFGTPMFKSIITRGSGALSVIKHVDGVSFTGSTHVGSMIAGEAGKHIKKHVLELGGSDPFIVLKSADLEEAAKNASLGRLQNNGQSCIASKRFIVQEDIFDEFHERLKDQFSSVIAGNPLEQKTTLGPLSSAEQTDTVMKQIGDLRKLGTVEMIGEKAGGIVPPSIALTNADYSEEVFGPVAILQKFRSNEEAVKIANNTEFGLGASVWGNPEEGEALAPYIDSGMVFVNHIVASDPRVPFGGAKKSGIGRELSRYGLLEFTNIKTVWVR